MLRKESNIFIFFKYSINFSLSVSLKYSHSLHIFFNISWTCLFANVNACWVTANVRLWWILWVFRRPVEGLHAPLAREMVNGVFCGCGLWQHMFLSPCLRATVWRCSPAGSTGQTDLSCRTLCHGAFRQIFTHSPALKTIYIISNDFLLLLTRFLSACPSLFASPWLTLARNHSRFDVLFEISAPAIAPIMKVGVPMPVPAPRDRRRCVEFNTREVTAPGTRPEWSRIRQKALLQQGGRGWERGL